MEDENSTVAGAAPDPTEQFEQAIDDFNRGLSEALRRGTPRPDPAAYLDRVPEGSRRRLFHELQKSRLERVVRNTREPLRVEEAAREYDAATDAELLELIAIEAEARVRSERREDPEGVRADLLQRFPQFAAELSNTFLGIVREAQREVGPPNPPGYEIKRRLGSGGQANVWLACRTGTGMLVALKVFRTQPPGHPDNDVLRDEADRLRRLRHRHIVRVIDCFEHAGYAYLVVDFIPGDTLRTRCRTSPWPLDKALTTVADLAEAVHFAHERGVLHLDLKLENVMLTRNASGHDAGAPWVEEDTPQIVDWGLRRVSRADGRTSAYGTPTCMSPEQARGEEPERRTDVWGLGGILYHLLLCRPLYDEQSAAAALARARDRQDYARPRELDTNIPADVEACLLKALHPDVAGRHSSAAALAAELRELAARHRPRAAGGASHTAEPPTAVAGPRAHLGLFAAAAALVLLLAGVAAVLSRTPGTSPGAPTAEKKDAAETKGDSGGPTPVPPVVAPPVAPPVMPVAAALEVDVRGIAFSAGNGARRQPLTDGMALYSRDQFRLHVRTQRECHVYVVNVDSREQVALLCPRPGVRETSRLPTGREVWLPGEAAGGQNLWYTLDENAGTDWIYLIAATAPVAELETLAAGTTPGAPKVPAVLTDLLSRYRGVEVKPANVAPIDGWDDPQVGWERVRAKAAEPPPELVVKGWRIVHRPR